MTVLSTSCSPCLRVITVFGTRPEAVKMAPVIQRLRATENIDLQVITTGQHREMLDQVLDLFGITPDEDLDVMEHGLGLAELSARMVEGTARVLRRRRPHLVLVQGDTSSVFAGALAAAYERVAVGHVEAGLRSFDRWDPFPEEINRRLVSSVAGLHFAPTHQARANLLAEGVDDKTITITGNTVIDALLKVRDSEAFVRAPLPAGWDGQGRLLLVTLHRREHWGEPMAAMCRALAEVLDRFPDTTLLFPMHRNPVVREAVQSALAGHPRAHLVEPLDYLAMVKAMASAYMVITDSGGLQEEAPALGRPVLVLRETTERPEAVTAGTARLVGTDPATIITHASELLSNPSAYQAMARAINPFGDGHAAERIVAAIQGWAVHLDQRPG